MPFFVPYDRMSATQYAHRWAYSRNPAYYDYEKLGGDCTNFASQCLFAGTGIMNYMPTYGWYYINANRKAPAWTGVEYFYNFITRDPKTPGPFGIELRDDRLHLLKPGDFVQLYFGGDAYGHTPIVVEIGYPISTDTILVAAHSQDADYRPLSTYQYESVRFLHILGAWLF